MSQGGREAPKLLPPGVWQNSNIDTTRIAPWLEAELVVRFPIFPVRSNHKPGFYTARSFAKHPSDPPNPSNLTGSD